MKIDKDRLNRVFFERPVGQRGRGRTFAACYQTLQQVSALRKSCDLVWPVIHNEMRQYNMRMLREMADHFGIVVSRMTGPYIHFANGARVTFIVPDRHDTRFRGTMFSGLVDDLGEFNEYATVEQRIEFGDMHLRFSHLTACPFSATL